MKTIFTKIIDGEIPCVKLHEDELCIVILDINPISKGHALVIPKRDFKTIMECPEETVKHMFGITKLLTEKMTNTLSCDGVNIFVNNKEAAGQEIDHLHIHVVPRFKNDGYSYKDGFGHVSYNEGEIEKFGKKLSLEY